MNHLFIINPTAGKNPDPYRLRAEIESVMREKAQPCVIKFTERAGHAEEIARAHLSDGGQWRVYACGGDGTLNEVLNGVVGFPNAAMTQLAFGTGNDFLRLFNPADSSSFRDVSAAVDGEERVFDLIEAAGRYSINICSVGLDARIAHDVHKFSKHMSGFAAYTTSGIVNILRGLSADYTIEADGENLDGRYTLICLANARYYGSGYMPMSDTNPADGVLDLLLIRAVSRVKALSVIALYKEGRYAELGDLAVRRAVTEVEIGFCGRTEQINTDGEIMMTTECVMRLSDQKMRFFAPYGSFDCLDI